MQRAIINTNMLYLLYVIFKFCIHHVYIQAKLEYKRMYDFQLKLLIFPFKKTRI